VQGLLAKKVWTIYVLFDDPTIVKQFRIDGGGATLPRYEIKDSSQRHAIVEFSDDLAGMVLYIQVVN
jgi:hypothetical protein